MKWGLHFDVASMKQEIRSLEEQSADPNFWSDMENSQKVLQRTKALKEKVQRFEKLTQEWEDLTTLVELGIQENDGSVLEEIGSGFRLLKENLEALKLETLLNGHYDKNNAILTLHPGAGGTEAQDWAEMLLRMYTRWAERRGFGVRTLDYLPGDEAGVKSVTILIEGVNAYGYSKCEKGIHRLQNY